MTFIQKSARLFEHLSADRRKAASRRGKTGLPTAQDGLSEKEKQTFSGVSPGERRDHVPEKNRIAKPKRFRDFQTRETKHVPRLTPVRTKK